MVFIDQIGNLAPSENRWSFWALCSSHSSSFGSVFANRNTFSMPTPSSSPLLRNHWKSLLVFDFWVMKSSSDLVASISLIHSNARVGFFAFEQTSVRKFTIQLWNPAWSRNFPRWISGEWYLGFIMQLWVQVPITHGMVSHRLETISDVQTFFRYLFPKSKLKALVATVLHFHFCCLISWIIVWFFRHSSDKLTITDASGNIFAAFWICG